MAKIPVSYSAPYDALLRDADARVDVAHQDLLTAKLVASLAVDARLAAEQRLQSLRDAKAALLSSVNRIFSADDEFYCRVPAVERLPLDVLSNVFLCCVDDYDHRAYRVPILPHPAFTVASVNRRWRSAAISASGVWSKLRIVFDDESSGTLLDHLTTILQRCKTGGFDVVLISTPGEEWDVGVTLRNTLARVLNRSHCVTVSWADPTVRFNNSFVQLLLCDMPALVSYISSQHRHNPTSFCFYEPPPLLKFLTLSPKLRVLDLDVMPYSLIQENLLPALEVLHTKSVLILHRVRELCLAFRNLKELSLYGIRFQSFRTIDDDAVFSKLRLLTCYNQSDSILVALKQRQLPLVDTLQLESRAPAGAAALMDFIAETPWSNICSLTITGRTASHFVKCFPHLPGVKTLVLVRLCAKEFRQLFELWHLDDEIGTPPHLRSLKLVSCDFGEGVFQKMVSFLLRRNSGAFHGGSRICDVSIIHTEKRGYDPLPQWLVPRLCQMVDTVSVVEPTEESFSRDL
ncbi:hypothetical protein AURDEDRAFT_165516 [Auricularia subglabra TFB-10046 SS5]|nr:hypothetical protein AURDEDRAFT_165516 [Auricularia subglabra TFB-10046 SS5]